MNQTEVENGALPHSSGSVKRQWSGLGEQWKLLGLFQIDPQHSLYSFTCMLKEGLAAAIETTINHPPPEVLAEEHFQQVVTETHKGFSMQTFAGLVFSNLRHSIGLTEEEYSASLTSHACYLQFISNSKSKANFFLTNDKKFFLKTQNKREVRFLLSKLRVYLQHLEQYPHSLLVRFLGVHRINVNHRQKKYFIVMKSVFYPDERIQARFDIKGCKISRWTEPPPESSQIIAVLKDLNFEGNVINLDQQRSWLLRQVELDTDFLCQLHVVDYSLLVAQQPLHQDEQHQKQSLATLIMRTKKSVDMCSTPTLGSLASVSGVSPKAESRHFEPKSISMLYDTVTMETASSPRAAQESSVDELHHFHAQNRRLLPNLRSPLHVIDGPETRYFVGIIDIFTVYGFRKRMEHFWKKLRHGGESFSTISPDKYSQRLYRWVQEHTQ